MLIEIKDSPVVALNRAVVIANIEGEKAALKAIAAIPARESLEKFYLYHAVLGHIHANMGNTEIAKQDFRRAMDLAETTSERRFIQRRLGELEAGLNFISPANARQ
jgi:RNA polymerase sigma-70 factor (ECF subfamily)